MMKVLVSDKLSTAGIDILKEAAGITVDVNTGLSPEELIKIIPEYHGLIIRSATKVTAEIIAAATNLKVVGRAGVGVDNIDIPAASKRGIVVMNTPGGNTIATAEHTISMLLALARNIPQANASLRNGAWDRKKYTGRELNGKTLGIIGMGRIGTEVVTRLISFNMKVLAFDPYLTAERAGMLGIERADLDQIIKEADVITVHTPLIPATKHLIDEAAIAKMKDGVILVNCARGGIIKESALVEALKSGKVMGAAIDVYEEEPTKNTELVAQPNAICVPHLGASTSEAQVSVAVDVAHQVIDYLINDNIQNALNTPAIPAEELRKVKPYLELSETLGSLVGQITEGSIKSIEISYNGPITESNTTPITVAALKGLLSRYIEEESINFINAPFIAKEHGIQQQESKTNLDLEYTNLIRISVVGEKETHTVAGTLYGMASNTSRVVEIDSFHLDTEPQGVLLICNNQDAPGIIGKVGTILGAHNLNIAAMQYSRKEAEKEALSVFSLDSDVSDAVLKELLATDAFSSIKRVRL